MNRYLKGVHITWFRGYKSFSFDGLRPITVFGGRNNCGKSSILEAICFLANRASGMTPGKLNWNRGEKMSARSFASLFYGGADEGEIIIHGVFSDGSTRGVDFECTHRSAVEFKLEDPPADAANVNGALPPTYVQQYYTNVDGKTSRGAMMIAFTKDEYRCYPLDPRNEMSGYGKIDGLSSDDDWRCAYYESQRRQPISAVYSELFKSGKDAVLLAALKEIDARISSVAFDGERLLIGLGENTMRLPLGAMGDGMVKTAEILSMMSVCPANGVLCLDEIENGLHHSVMRSFWLSVVRLARVRNIQIVATTHNLEMLQALSQEIVGSGDDFVFVNLTRSPTDDVGALTFNFSEFSAHLDSGVEMQGFERFEVGALEAVVMV